MRLRRRTVDFLIKTCRLGKLQNGRTLRAFRDLFDEIDLQHVRDSHPCRSLTDRSEMFRYLHDTFVKGEPVTFLEFGVFKGDSIREWASLNKHQDSQFVGFDSFEGLPETWRPGQEAGHFKVNGTMPQIDDSRVRFVKGWFENTVPGFAREFTSKNRLVLHLDADLYGSTMLPLVHFTPFMSQGTLLIFDEFYDRQHEFKALQDWQKIYRKPFRIVAEMQNYGRICAELV